MENVLYGVGLTLVILYLALGIDDFLWDILSLLKRVFRRSHKPLDMQKLDSVPPKLLAIVIAAWQEENVLEDVIDNILASAQYPLSMYHIFLGVYPNDAETLLIAKNLEQKHPNVHVIVNCKPGPTSKAQNINHVINQIKLFEHQRKWCFASMTIHDAEDVVHPLEFKVTNYLLAFHQVMQFPVFPIIEKPTLRNFSLNITTATYADEFAENHFITMRNRRNLGALVPSAGTGFVISRQAIQYFGKQDALSKDSLTEDYLLALTFFERNIQNYYVFERVPRITEGHKQVWDFIATRSIFPNTLKAAVKQKCRWVLGITMRSFGLANILKNKQIGILKNKQMSLAGRYSMYKDLKPKVSNLFSFVGYPVVIYFVASLFYPAFLPIYPQYSLSWYLSLAVLVIMLKNQIAKGIAIYNVYGMRSVFLACLFPPIVSVRTVWGNLINTIATLKAHKQNIFGNSKTPSDKKLVVTDISKAQEKKKLAWAKTDHSFLGKDILKRYHRKLGDVLLEKGSVTVQHLQRALLESKAQDKKLGAYLVENKIITEAVLMEALARVKLMPFVKESSLNQYNLAQYAYLFRENLLRELLIVPLLETDKGFVVAFCNASSENAQEILRRKYHIEVTAVFISEKGVLEALSIMYHSIPNQAHSLIMELYEQGRINYEQVIIAFNFKHLLRIEDADILLNMGLQFDEIADMPWRSRHKFTVPAIRRKQSGAAWRE
ncbi:MAG: phage adsorption protein NrfB [Peptococcaceae bacterium]|nr:phage adsorption protein NrfB [Peptococcaceae bacterium]